MKHVFRYTMKFRPPDKWTLPLKPWALVERPRNDDYGFRLRTDLPISEHQFGVVEFGEKLDDAVVRAFELVFLGGFYAGSIPAKKAWKLAWRWLRYERRGGPKPNTQLPKEAEWFLHTCIKAMSDRDLNVPTYSEMDLRMRLAAHLEAKRDLRLGGGGNP